MVSCVPDDGADNPGDGSQLVVEGWINVDGYPEVMLTRSIVPGNGDVTINDVFVPWAKVTITDGVETCVMAGGPTKYNYPPYLYTAYEFAGKPGKTYTITAEYNGMKVVASSRMLEPPTLCDITFGDADDGHRTVTLKFRHNTDEIGYYVAFCKVFGKEDYLFPAMLGTIIADGGEGTVYSLPLFRGITHVFDNDYNSNFNVGDFVEVLLAQVEKNVYDYYAVYNDLVLFEHSLFINANDNLHSNVDGGLGIWSARGGRPIRFVVK